MSMREGKKIDVRNQKRFEDGTNKIIKKKIERNIVLIKMESNKNKLF